MAIFIYGNSYKERFARRGKGVPRLTIMEIAASITTDEEYSFDNTGMLSHGHCLETENGRRPHETYQKVRELLWSNSQIPFIVILDLSHPSEEVIKEIQRSRRWYPLAVFILYCTNEEYERCLSEVSDEWSVRLTRFFRLPKSKSRNFHSAFRKLLDAAGATATDKVANAKFFSAFISYSHSDKTFARWLHDALSAAGITCWLDEKNMRAGDRINSKIEGAIKHRDKVLLCASKSSLTSWWVENELNSVIQKEQELWKKTGEETLVLIPLNLDGYMFSDAWTSGWKNQVVSRLAPDFTSWHESFNKEAVQPVVNALILDTTAIDNRFSDLSK